MGNSHLAPGLFLLILLISSGGLPCPVVKAQEPGQGSWCIPRPSAAEEALMENINFACGTEMDCSIIQEGGACYYPNNLMSHTSVAMNLYYQKLGRHYSGLIVVTDPSYGDCIYEYARS